ncbi:hypothetical protein LX15_003519 [Streptoalloteichus tenebrarius]|uniref:Uncharacterized protein n=1 Tax=Streptoalloteichus tenebrarius (strain ATCC 17920 / DSM 40477 / JCM 4838 / CBS 697.72 / NBRC 16177 / NCIMB 11028 / NRRL B-12390 / A12253. 1 / ISP 5477) TaxID=1933 RepID=A0ABT1HWB8_STRSD|nr:hypothetical protein [Streptoalloteichus tenebrarius]MCP2259810.1 hypothetical protein [Streptoalloteichus tenebrarius]BFE99243.1 hypothetical protein GCM10020241_09190 [Streptoalloteichus tenebrarius]
MEIEVDLYSGRPNPRLPLGGEAAAELVRRLAALSSTAHGSPATGLGYRGIRIVNESDEHPFAEVVVSRGVVVVRDRQGGERRLGDPDRALESWLVDVVAAGLEPDTARYVREELGSV